MFSHLLRENLADLAPFWRSDYALRTTYRKELAQLRSNLASNIFQDMFYDTYPGVPTGFRKETREYGPYRVKFLVGFAPSDSTVLSLVVREDEVFLGTLRVDVRGKSARAILPGAESDHAKHLSRLVEALVEIDAMDMAMRERVSEVPEP